MDGRGGKEPDGRQVVPPLPAVQAAMRHRAAAGCVGHGMATMQRSAAPSQAGRCSNSAKPRADRCHAWQWTAVGCSGLCGVFPAAAGCQPTGTAGASSKGCRAPAPPDRQAAGPSHPSRLQPLHRHGGQRDAANIGRAVQKGRAIWTDRGMLRGAPICVRWPEHSMPNPGCLTQC